MIKGITLNEVAKRVAQQEAIKRDFYADTRTLRVTPDLKLRLEINDTVEHFGITNICHRSLGKEAEMPVKYYDKVKESCPSLLAQNVNWWLHSEPEIRMLRTFGGSHPRARVLLSEKYRPLDNAELINNLLPLLDEKGADIKSCNVSEKDLYIHATFPKIQREIAVGDVVESGVQISNSEVGLKSLWVRPWINRLKCSNGMAVPDSGVRKYHVGKSQSNGDLSYGVLSSETKKKTDVAFWSQVRDVVKSTLDVAKFEAIVEQYSKKAKKEITTPARAVEIVTEKYSLTENESKSMLQHLCEDKDYSQWGVANSVTRMAHDTNEYDRAVELENIGGMVMELAPNSWD